MYKLKTISIKRRIDQIPNDLKNFSGRTEIAQRLITPPVSVFDWKTGEEVRVMSQGEADWYTVLRFDDSIDAVFVNYPLDRRIIEETALSKGVEFMDVDTFEEDGAMSSDIVICTDDNKFVVCTVRPSRMMSSRAIQLLAMEYMYWQDRSDAFHVLFEEDLNVILVDNIRTVVEYYNDETVYDDISMMKNLIARKVFGWDMENVIITDEKLIEKLDKLESYNSGR